MNKIEESAKSEFKPVFGKGVEKDDQKINDKAYADMNQEIKNYYKGISDIRQRASEGYDYSDGKGMSDIRFDGPVGDDYVKRIEAQLRGYTSADAEKAHKNDPFGNADFGDKKYTERFKKNAKWHKDRRGDATKIGLTGRELDPKEVDRLRTTAFNENKKIRRLTFKNTQFISESHMMSRIPDDMKVEGKRFIMRDAMQNEYLVEWHRRMPEVTKMVNKRVVNEEMKRIKELYGFEHGKNHTSPQERIQEDTEFSDMLNRARSLSD